MGKRKTADLVKLAERQQWRVETTKKGWMLYPPDKTKPAVLLHNTPSDHRAYLNDVARLKRSGLVIRQV